MAGRFILLWGWRRSFVALLAGAPAVLTQAPFDFPAAGFIAFPILVWLLDGAAEAGAVGLWRRFVSAFGVGWWFGFGYFLAGLWWIGQALLVEADDFAWAMPFAVIGIPLVMAFFYGFATAIARLFWSDGIGRIAGLAVGFAVAEWLRGFLLTGFPWNPIGYGAMPVPLLMQSVTVAGVVGMNALAVFVFAMPALLAGREHRRLGAVLALALIALHLGFGLVRLDNPPASGKTLAVRVVQPDIDLSEKWDDAVRDRVFDTTMKLSAAPPAPGAKPPQLIVWPETAVPFLFTDRPDALAAIAGMLAPGQMLMTGAVRMEAGNGPVQYTNSVLLIDDAGEIVDAIDKEHLVPFGEYIPFARLLRRVGVEQLVAGPMNFVTGASRHPMAIPGGLTALPFVCYEIIFPGLVGQGAKDADVLVNVTNDAWFGDTPGPYQHLRQAQLRAVETGRPVIRAANTGVSAVIDSQGRIVEGLAMNARGAIDLDLGIPKRADLPSWRWLNELVIMLTLVLFSGGIKLRQVAGRI